MYYQNKIAEMFKIEIEIQLKDLEFIILLKIIKYSMYPTFI